MKKHILLCCIGVFCVWLSGSKAFARVIFSEVLWSGTDLSTADEWLELAFLPAKSSGTTQDLSGWEIRSGPQGSGSKLLLRFATGSLIASGQYLVVSNYSEQESRLLNPPFAITKNIVLPNNKLLLGLYDASGSLIDTADDGIGKPMAGYNASGTGYRASMMRLFPPASGSLSSSWASSATFIGLDDGTPVFATPGFANGAGYDKDVFPPHDSQMQGVLSGQTLALSWSPSTSVDIAAQILTLVSSDGSGSSIDLSAATTSYQTGSLSYSGAVTAILRMRDYFGNVSSGSVLTPEQFDVPPVSSGNTLHSETGSLIFVSELLPNPSGRDDGEWIELAFVGSGAFSFSGITVTDGSREFVIPSVATISGAVFLSGTHLLLEKSVTGISLDNAGDSVRLLSGSRLLDEFSYFEAPEGISFGRMFTQSGASALTFCTPTPGRTNATAPSDVYIGVQNEVEYSTGNLLSGTGKVTVNLIAQSVNTSLSSAVCNWVYSDGFSSESCNPPSHTFSTPGAHFVTLKITDYCDDTVEQTIRLFVFEKIKSTSNSRTESAKNNEQNSCSVLSYDGMRISEMYPDPYGNESDQEFIELKNITDGGINLCGWSIDDAEGGSKPFALDGERVAAGEYLVIPRSQSKIALNNDSDEVRLFAPIRSSSGTVLADSVAYDSSAEGESYALRKDDVFVWTPYGTPGKENVFRSPVRRFPDDKVVLSAALPNPVGKDNTSEWIEISNVSSEEVDVSDWSLVNKAGKGKRYVLNSAFLQPTETLRLSVQTTEISLVNTFDALRLNDPDGYTVSTLSWTEAVEGRIYRQPFVSSVKVRAKVLRVVDGDTADIVLTDPDQFAAIPPSLKRRWLGVSETDRPYIRLRLLGVDTPETVHPKKEVQKFGKEASDFLRNLIEGKSIELTFDDEIWDKYDRLLAYVYTSDGRSVQAQLLREGLAYAYLRFPFKFADLYEAYESEAKSALLGLWADETASMFVDEQKNTSEIEAKIEQEGIILSVDPPSGIVESGTTMRVTSSVLSDVFLSVNSGSYSLLSGSHILVEDQVLKLYAVRNTASGSVRSNEVTRAYVLKRERYPNFIRISEAYPSPNKGEEEWIELFNASSGSVNLAGWQLDDTGSGGSAAWTFPQVRMESGAYLTVSRAETGIALNNNGDDIRLTDPNGHEQSFARYGAVSRGQSAVFSSSETCISDVQTMGRENICIALDKSKNAPDADRDFLSDDYEQYLYSTNGENPDSDGDSFLDGFEVQYGSDPLKKTSEDRQIIVANRNFLLEKLKPKFRTYKTKGVVFEVKNIEGFGFLIEEDGTSFDVPRSGSSAALKFSVPDAQSKERSIDLKIIDPTNTTHVFHRFYHATIDAKKEGNAASSKQKTPVRYVNVFADESIESQQLPPSNFMKQFLPNLFGRLENSSKDTSKNTQEREAMLIRLFLVFSSGCIVFFVRKKYLSERTL